ncbi:MAG: hypothetical protein ACLR6I_11735 [Waltera sp.]
MNKLMQTVTENVAYVVIFLAVIVGCFLVAVVLEKSAQKKTEFLSRSSTPESLP